MIRSRPFLRPLSAPVLAATLLVAPPAALAQDDLHLDALVLMDVARAGPDLVAVGERGTVLRTATNDVLRTAAPDLRWSRAATTVSRTLTGIAFASPTLGVAVGHGGVLLRSDSGGRDWTEISTPAVGQASLLGVAATGPANFAAFGAFGMLATSDDGGLTWTRREVLGPDFDRHLYALLPLDAATWMLAGESGTLALTADGGAHWSELRSPYQGSFFGLVRTADNAILAFGMRGHVFRSDDRGTAWTAITTGTTTGFNAGRMLDNGTVVLAGNGGMLAVSGDDGRSFRLIKAASPAGLAQVAGLSDGAVLTVGEAGLSRIVLETDGNDTQKNKTTGDGR